MTSAYVSRINQLDALQLDEEIYHILQNRVQQIAKLFTPGVTEIWKSEMNATLRTLIWLFSLNRGKSTFGQQLLDLTYTNLTKKKAILYLFISVTSEYFNNKYLDSNRIIINDKTKIIRKYLEKLVAVFHLLSFMNLLLFLHRGYQPTILEKIINISSHNISTHKSRTLGYSYVTRELLWHSLMELFTIGLPMINVHYLKQYLFRLWPRRKEIIPNLIVPTMTIDTMCPYCNENPILPRHAGCDHIYCYYCMMAHFTATESFNCIVCGIELHRRDMKIYLPPLCN